MSIPNNTFISISIVDDGESRKLNKEHLGKDCSTDVLSFNIDQEVDGKYYLGDIIVNKQQAERQAEYYGNSVEEEISELVSHGVLHLLGIHHEGDGK